MHRGRPSTWQEAADAFHKATTEGSVAVVDGRPGRAVSAVLEAFAKRYGSYHTVAAREEQSLAPYSEWSGVPASALGYDFENARTVVSFGVPLLDGWGAPGVFARRWAKREARLIQIELTLSRTAACAWKWVRGTALPQELRSALEPPVLAISDDADSAVAALNLELGGHVVQRRDFARPGATLAGSHRAILIDATVPWEFEPNVQGERFRLAAWDGGGSKDDWLLPAPGFLEELTDIPTAPASPVATYAIAAPLLKPEHMVSTAAEFIGGSAEKAIRTRCEQLAVSYDELIAGKLWTDDPKNTKVLNVGQVANLRRVANPPLPPTTWASGWAVPVLPPLAPKLYQESNLRMLPPRRQA